MLLILHRKNSIYRAKLKIKNTNIKQIKNQQLPDIVTNYYIAIFFCYLSNHLFGYNLFIYDMLKYEN